MYTKLNETIPAMNSDDAVELGEPKCCCKL